MDGLGTFLDSQTATMLTLAAAALILVFWLASALAARRRQGREVRELVLAVEELRSGHWKRRSALDGRSPLALVSDAVQRLGHDLSTRWREAEGAGRQLNAVMDVARDIAVITVDQDLDLHSASAGARALFGWDDNELLGHSLSVLFEERAWKDFLPKLARRALRDVGIETETVLQRRDGTAFEGHAAVRALYAPSGDSMGLLIVLRDRTVHARLEDELRRSEERYRQLVESMAHGVFIATDGHVAYANPALAELLAVSLDDLAGMRIRDLVVARDVLLAEELFGELEAGRRTDADFVATLRRGDGQAGAEVRVVASPIEYAGRPAVLGTVEDETAERRARSELHRNERQLDAVIEGTTDPILVFSDTGEGGTVHLVNSAFLGLTGLNEREVLGASEGALLRLLRERGQGDENLAAFLAASSGGSATELIQLGVDTVREVEATVAVLTDSAGLRLGRVLVCRDQTVQRRSERSLQAHAAELRAKQDELRAAYERLSELNNRLERRGEKLDELNRELRTLDGMKSDLLGNVSHELQTPLVSIRGFTEMILKGRLGEINEEQRKGLELSLKNIDRLIAMIDNLLAISRLDPGAEEPNTVSFPLRQVVDEAVDLLRQKLEARGLTFECSIMPRDLAVQADREMALQIFVNLLSNAIKFNRDGGHIEVVARRGEPGFAEVQVRDTGIGISREERERVFERFYRSDASAGATQGTGLGLAIVRSILERHGCTIRVDSEPGQGTVFIFSLPQPEPGSGGSDGEDVPPLRIIRPS